MSSLVDIQTQWAQQQAFVCCKMPHATHWTYSVQAQAQTWVHNAPPPPGWIFHPFDQGSLWVIPAVAAQWKQAPLTSTPVEVTPVDPAFWPPSGQAEHLERLERCIAALQSGALQKLVLARQEVKAWPDFPVLDLLDALAEHYPNAFVYAFYTPILGLWVGASPEVLLSAQAGQLYTVALAGTQPWQEGPLAWGTKEQHEQQWVTDAIVEALASITTHLDLEGPYTVQAGPLAHLKTDIRATLADTSSLWDVALALHPTPAVCGLPKQAAHSLLRELEAEPRAYYAGFMGFLGFDGQQLRPDYAHLQVNLRCLSWQNDRCRLYMGGGILADSNPQLEWLETVHKSRVMKRVLQALY